MSTPITTDPPSFIMGSSERRTLSFDFDADLSVAETISSASAVLTDLSNNETYAAGLSGNPSIASLVVSQTVLSLVAGHRYRLAVTAVVSSTKHVTAVLSIECPY
jgi:hypothetical protein